MLGFAHSAEIIKFLPGEYFKRYRLAKAKLGITTRGILPDDEHSRKLHKEIYADVAARVRPVFRLIPKEQFPFKGEITIYGSDKVSIADLEKDHLVGLIIENARFHQMMRMIFELSWKGAEGPYKHT